MRQLEKDETSRQYVKDIVPMPRRDKEIKLRHTRWQEQRVQKNKKIMFPQDVGCFDNC